VIIRLLAIPAIIWALGFALFVLLLPKPASDQMTDAIVVVTGGPGRIQRGISLLEAGKAKRMLISGVDRQVKQHELALEYEVPILLFRTRIDLGNESVDTRSNAIEASEWLNKRHYKSVRLVTTDWHMPRARFELMHALEADVVVVADAVPSQPGLVLLLREYNKYLLRRAAALFGI
jgi:uncharacterized SAM-binding protein YcdF (DUF218 family)